MTRSLAFSAVALVLGCSSMSDPTEGDEQAPAGDAGASSSRDGSVGAGDGASSSRDGSASDGSGGAGSDGSGGPASADGGGPQGGDAAVAPVPCTPDCAAGAVCTDHVCRCLPGFSGDGATCTRQAPPAGVATRSQADVCAAWTAGHVTTATSQYTPGTGGACDPGVMDGAAMYDAANRWSMYRWLVGLPAVSIDASRNADLQVCALVLQYSFSHEPDPSTMCYTPGGADAASRSMICGGDDAALCMDAYALESYATDDHLSHRKIVIGTSRDNVGFGASSGGSCALYGYSASTPPTPPPYVTIPNMGFAPIETATSTWSIHPTVDGQVLPIGVTTVVDELDGHTVATQQNLEYAGINGFDILEGVVAGHTYRVKLTDGTSTVDYETTPVSCP